VGDEAVGDDAPMQACTTIRIGCVLAAFAVVAGALGSHALDLPEPAAGQYETAVRYHMYHALGLLVAGILGRLGHRTGTAAWCMLLGSLVFSGTVYAIALGGPKWLGAITPLGGLSLIVAWLLLALAAGRTATAQPL
jgi:uncharacterized membrane protein YgdD (TMEM256/DUF423 family)